MNLKQKCKRIGLLVEATVAKNQNIIELVWYTVSVKKYKLGTIF